MKEVSARDGHDATKGGAGDRSGWYHGNKDRNGKDLGDAEIMDLLPIEELGLLASAGRDKKICLWNMENLQPKAPLLGHTQGVYSLDWCADNSMILSAGLDHDVFIWNPHV